MTKLEKEEKFVEEIKGKINTQDLHISRIPMRTKRWFIDYSNDYFCGDYGLCYKHIIDTFRGMTPVGYDELHQRIDLLEAEIEQLKMSSMQEQDKKNVIKMADGREIRRKRE